jgi:hypothetical protein
MRIGALSLVIVLSFFKRLIRKLEFRMTKENKTYDIFIDESCHLENDKIPLMCIGYVKVNRTFYSDYWEEMKSILNQFNQNSELKWNKFSNSRVELYKRLVDMFFKNDIDFRCVVVKYKERLNHDDFNHGSHDNFYYKMIYYLLRPNDNKNENYRVFIDFKDTRGREKLTKIKEVFNNYFYGESPFKLYQHLHSHDNLFLQLADFLIGAVAYKSRVELGDIQSPTLAKMEFIEYLEELSGFSLNEGTPPWETKFNIFDHQPKQKA